MDQSARRRATHSECIAQTQAPEQARTALHAVVELWDTAPGAADAAMAGVAARGRGGKLAVKVVVVMVVVFFLDNPRLVETKARGLERRLGARKDRGKRLAGECGRELGQIRRMGRDGGRVGERGKRRDRVERCRTSTRLVGDGLGADIFNYSAWV